MSIDPRTLKQMIQIQLAPNLDFQSNTNPLDVSSGDGTTTLFDTLLSQLMNTSDASDLSEASQLVSDPLALLASIPNLYGAAEYDSSDAAAAGSSDYDSFITQAAAKYGVDPELVRAVIKTESNFQSDAVSSSGAKGLMQLMDATARSLGVSNSLDPQQNIEGGTRYLSYLLGKYNGNVQVALAAYNAGPGRVDRTGIKTDSELQANLGLLPEETQHYVWKVQQARQ